MARSKVMFWVFYYSADGLRTRIVLPFSTRAKATIAAKAVFEATGRAAFVRHEVAKVG